MANSITKLDFENAFKSLSEIEVPVVKRVKPNKIDSKLIVESLNPYKYDRTSALLEDYYDISDSGDMTDAKNEREDEIKAAKYARIEKIVDLNASSPEDLLPSYVNKLVIQCPQCMTLFYKDDADVEASGEGELTIGSTVNVGEECQHCGNDSGYLVMGKVAPVTGDEVVNYAEGKTEKVPAEEETFEETEEELPATDETEETGEDLDLDAAIDEASGAEEDEVQESFTGLGNTALTESADKELDEKLKKHNDYIEYLSNAIADEEAAMEKAENDEIKAAIERKLESLRTDLEAALPDVLKGETTETVDENVDEVSDDAQIEDTIDNEIEEPEITDEETAEEVTESLTEAVGNTDMSDKDLIAMFRYFEKNPVTSAEVEADLASGLKECKVEEAFDDIDDLDEESVEAYINESLTNVYENVESFKLTKCSLDEGIFTIEGLANFKGSNTAREIKYTFTEACHNSTTVRLTGTTTDLGTNGRFVLEGVLGENKTLIAESLSYKYNIGKNIVEGLCEKRTTLT